MHKYPYRDTELAANSLAFDASLPRSTHRLPKKRSSGFRYSWLALGVIVGGGIAAGLLAMTNLPANGLLASSSRPMEAHTANADTLSAAEEYAIAATTPKPPAPRPTSVDLSVKRGDTLSDLLIGAGIGEEETHNILASLRKEYNPRRLIAGQKVELHFSKAEQAGAAEDAFNLASLRIKLSPRETVELMQTQKDAFSVKVQKETLEAEVISGGGTISSSLYQTGVDSGVSPAVIGALINAYSYDVDFQRDVKQGDSFHVLYERLKNKDGETAGTGKLLFATLTLSGDEKKIYHYISKDGLEDYYDATGQSIRKALLRTPVNGARLSSGFGMRRHPVLGYSKMHKGVDFAAPTGTPIYAAGDGVIEYAARKGSYGNYVRIRHNNQYATAYAHMSKFASKTAKGKRVRQGDIIGYVGTTGRSTGPHLHYEVLAYDHQVNPNGVKFQAGNKLAGRELANFKASIQETELLASRLIYNERKLASAQ